MTKAEDTRRNILNKAFELIYRNGYEATSLDDILSQTTVTKGAFYYHFKSKEELGIAMLDEVVMKAVGPLIRKTLDSDPDVRTALYNMMKVFLLESPFFVVEYGCPAVNLVEEMAAKNKRFKSALKAQFDGWQQAIEAVIRKGQSSGQLAADHDPAHIAGYILASYQGIRSMGKLNGKPAYRAFLAAFKNYLQGLE
jgi:AcrR family transcriptional regulator